MLTYLGLRQSHFLDSAAAVTELLWCGRVQLRHLDRPGSSSRQRTTSDEGMAAMADIALCNTTLWHVLAPEGIITPSGSVLCSAAVETCVS